MSQSSFVLEKDLQFIDVGYLAKVGDVFVYTPPQTMVVYRNGDIQIRMAMTQAAIDGLLINGSFKRVPSIPEAVQAPEVVVPPVVEEAPVVVTESAPVVTETAPVVTDEAPVAPEEAPAATEDSGVAEGTPEVAASEEETAAPKKTGKKSKK